MAASPSRIRQHIAILRLQRERLERKLMAHRRGMIDACLIARKELAGGKLRKSPAFYLSRKIKGKTKLTYVRKVDLAGVRRATDGWREFSSALADWVKLTERIQKLFRDLGQAQLKKRKEG